MPSTHALLFAGLALFTPFAASHAQRVRQAPLYPAELDSAGLARLIDSNLTLAREAHRRLVAYQGKSEAKASLRAWDETRRLANDAQGLAAIAMDLHPDSSVRAEGLAGRERVSRFRSELSSDPRAARRFQELDTTRLSPVERLYVSRTVRDFRRAGVLLPEAQRVTVRGHLETLDRLSARFARNLAEDTTRLLVSSRDLGGLPEDWIARHRPDAEGRLALTLSYPDVFPVLQYAASRSLRERMFVAFDRRGRPGNRIVLDSLLRVREAVAGLLGYPDWAAYQLEPLMAVSPDTVERFIERAREALTPARKRIEARRLELLRQEDSTVGELALWDRTYGAELQRRAEFGVDSRAVREYFPFEVVQSGILEIAAELFGVTLRPASLPVWHPSVESFEVLERGQPLGRFYLDLHPRPGKYQHAALFPVRLGMTGRWLPEGVLVANLPGGVPGDPSLMEMSDVVTFFHEFGHLLHHMFGRQPYTGLQWPEETDFVEAPSQMLEELVQHPQVLRRLSRHVRTGQPIPDTLVARLRAADAVDRPSDAAFQSGLAAISLAIHTAPAASVNVDSIAYRKLADYTGARVPDPTHFPTSFDHLGSNGYAAAYYSYLWSQVIAKDLWSTFDPADPLDTGPAHRYRDGILRPGGGRPAAELVRQLLGRPFGFENWRRWLEGNE